MAPLRWQLPHGVSIAMSLASDGDLRNSDARRSWCRRHAIPEPAVLRQVHGAEVLSPARDGEDGDALVCEAVGYCLGVFGADCPPLVIAAPSVLAVAHCGWRGTAIGIVANTIACMRRHDNSPGNGWAALVGPGVHPDDFEVDAPVLGARAWPAGCLRQGRAGHAWLDLPAAVAADCIAHGVHNVARTTLTTSRDARLRSHRRDGPGHPHLLVAWRSSCAG